MIRLTWKRFSGALRMLARSEQGPRALILAMTLMLLMLGTNGLNVINSYVARDFMSSIASKNISAFTNYGLLYSVVIFFSTLIAVFHSFVEKRLSILWREQLTWRLTSAYLSERTYYRLASATGIENPDQRITEDVRAFTKTTLSFVLLFVNGVLTAISFSGVLWAINPFLFVVATAYAIIGTAITIGLGRPLIRLNYHQFDMEANFRSDLIHIRENSDSIALAHHEERFSAKLRNRLNDLIHNVRRVFIIERNLSFFTVGYNNYVQLIPALIIAPLFIVGEVEFGVITQATLAFASLMGAFSIFVTQFQSISSFTAVTTRLHLLTESIENAHRIAHSAIIVAALPDRVRYEDVTLYSADKSRVLVEKLNLEVNRNSRWLFNCVDHEPKVALFLATAGIWGSGIGRIFRPGLEDILFLPERTYLPPVCLRDILLRTGMEAVTKDAEIYNVFQKLGLEEPVRRAGGLDAAKDWSHVFSIGEQHMLSITRILLANPAFVFLDRPESSLSRNQISIILDTLEAQGVGVVVFSDKGEAGLSFDAVLNIGLNSSWEVTHKDGSIFAVNHTDLKDLSV
jgi:putative ATP-binding cassette transporter